MSTDNPTPVERVQGQIDELFADPDLELAEVIEQVARLSVRLVIQSALEADRSSAAAVHRPG